MQIVGHDKQREILQATRTSAVLLQGPSGVGKWLCARSHADSKGGAEIILRDGPTVEDARQVAELFTQRPTGGRSAVSLVDLDRCGERVQNTLLKTIEEMPEWGQVVMVASFMPMATIRSRCEVIWFPPLHEQEVAEVLVRLGYSPAESKLAATMGNGSVETALKFRESIRSKPVAMSYVDVVTRHDRVALTTMQPRLDEGAKVMVWRWITEVLTDHPRVFTKDELSQVYALGVKKFYVLVECLQAGDSLDLAAQKVWTLQ